MMPLDLSLGCFASVQTAFTGYIMCALFNFCLVRDPSTHFHCMYESHLIFAIHIGVNLMQTCT